MGALLHRPVTRAALVAAVRDAETSHLSTQDRGLTSKFAVPFHRAVVLAVIARAKNSWRLGTHVSARAFQPDSKLEDRS